MKIGKGILFFGILIFITFVFAGIGVYAVLNTSVSGCNNYYYFDNTDKTCSQKQFCGAYMYYGLYTFETKEECLKEANEINNASLSENDNEDNNQTDEDESDDLENDDNGTEIEDDNKSRINSSVYCTDDCPRVCCNIKGVHTTKCNKCVCEKQYGGVVIRDKKCDKVPAREIKEIKKEFRGDIKEILKEYNGTLRLRGSNISINELSDEQREIIADKINAQTGLNLTVEDINNKTILKTRLSNGRYAEIKIMPDAASEIALSVLKAKCEIRNCTVELKEVGVKNNNETNKTKVAYEITTEKGSRFLFLFKNKMTLKARIDAETGEIISIKRPWWAFLAREESD